MIFNLTTPAVSKLPKFTYTGTYELIDDGGGNWRIKFLTSGVLTLLKKLIVDVFLVGGGGAAGISTSGTSKTLYGSGGGAGGYTLTQKSVVLEPGDYQIVVGAGGVGANSSLSANVTDGGASTAFGFTANGGSKALASGRGANGGSGGGAGGYITEDGTMVDGAAGGSNGSNGTGTLYTQGGTGQGTTTREFGEDTGDLYAGAGGGGGAGLSGSRTKGAAGGAGGGGNGASISGVPGHGTDNTGGGAGGGFSSKVSNQTISGGNGGSGIVIMRNHREVAA